MRGDDSGNRELLSPRPDVYDKQVGYPYNKEGYK